MPLLLAILPYVICGGILWLIILQFSPINSTTSLWQVIGVVFLLGVAQRVWRSVFEQPSWLLDTSVHFAVLVLLLVALLRLSLRNALVAATVYFVAFLIVSTVIRIVITR